MLRIYPIEAVDENWLHEAVIDILKKVHLMIDDEDSMTKTQAGWLNLLESCLTEDLKQKLRGLTGLRDRVFSYYDILNGLEEEKRNNILEIIDEQNDICNILSDEHSRIRCLENDYEEVHNIAKDLFTFCYGKLKDFEIRDRQYKIIFESLPDKFCPFCGLEMFNEPHENDQDQDHYLAKSIYPFSGSNMRNLVPMCIHCNRDYKKAQNMIFDDSGVRRKALDPYVGEPIKISLLHSELTDRAQNPSWSISFIPNCPEAETWDQVFQIRERLTTKVFDRKYENWIRQFEAKCRKDRERSFYDGSASDDYVRSILNDYLECLLEVPLSGIEFFQYTVFEFLLAKFDQGEEQIIQHVRHLVLGENEEDVA